MLNPTIGDESIPPTLRSTEFIARSSELIRSMPIGKYQSPDIVTVTYFNMKRISILMDKFTQSMSNKHLGLLTYA